MPQQRTRDEAGEVGLIGLAVALLTAGMERIGSDLAVGGALLAVGLVVLFIAIRFRNATIGVAPEKVINAVEDAADRVMEALTTADEKPAGETPDATTSTDRES